MHWRMENETGLKVFFWIGTVIMLLMTLLVVFATIMYQKKLHKIKQAESENLFKASIESEKREGCIIDPFYETAK